MNQVQQPAVHLSTSVSTSAKGHFSPLQKCYHRAAVLLQMRQKFAVLSWMPCAMPLCTTFSPMLAEVPGVCCTFLAKKQRDKTEVCMSMLFAVSAPTSPAPEERKTILSGKRVQQSTPLPHHPASRHLDLVFTLGKCFRSHLQPGKGELPLCRAGAGELLKISWILSRQELVTGSLGQLGFAVCKALCHPSSSSKALEFPKDIGAADVL